MCAVTVNEEMHLNNNEFAADKENAWESSTLSSRNNSKVGVLQSFDLNKLPQTKTVSGDADDRTSMIQICCTKGDNNVKCHKVIVHVPETVQTQNPSTSNSVLETYSTLNLCGQTVNTSGSSSNIWGTSVKTSQLVTCNFIQERTYPLFKREELERKYDETQSATTKQPNKIVLTEKCTNTNSLAKSLVKKSFDNTCSSLAEIASKGVNHNLYNACNDVVRQEHNVILTDHVCNKSSMEEKGNNNTSLIYSPQQCEQEQKVNIHNSNKGNENISVNDQCSNLSLNNSHCDYGASQNTEKEQIHQANKDVKQEYEKDEQKSLQEWDKSSEQAQEAKPRIEPTVLSAFDVMKSAAAKRNRNEGENGEAVKTKSKRRKGDADAKEESKASKVKKAKEKELSNTKSLAKLARASAKNKVNVMTSSNLFDDDDDNDYDDDSNDSNNNHNSEDSKRKESEADRVKMQQSQTIYQTAISSTKLERNNYHNNIDETMPSNNDNLNSEADSKAVSEFAIANTVNDDIILCDETIPSVFRPPSPVSKEKKHANSCRSEGANSTKVKANVDKSNETSSHQLTLQCFFTPAVMSFQQEYMREEKTEMSVVNGEYICRDVIVYRSTKTGDVISEQEYYKRSNAMLKK